MSVLNNIDNYVQLFDALLASKGSCRFQNLFASHDWVNNHARSLPRQLRYVLPSVFPSGVRGHSFKASSYKLTWDILGQ